MRIMAIRLHQEGDRAGEVREELLSPGTENPRYATDIMTFLSFMTLLFFADDNSQSFITIQS